MNSTRQKSATFRSLGARSAALVAVLAFTGCTRTVKWEEEVPLNTGETIWVERSTTWAPLGSLGNPVDIAMRPTRDQKIRFTYHGRPYEYVGRADVGWIAVSPLSGMPVLVAPASSFAWDKQNRFLCAVPHYVQLEPDSSGQNWKWPERIEPWLYNLPANMMASIPALKEQRKARYTRQDREIRDAVYRQQFPPGAYIDPQYKQNGCLVKFGRKGGNVQNTETDR